MLQCGEGGLHYRRHHQPVLPGTEANAKQILLRDYFNICKA